MSTTWSKILQASAHSMSMTEDSWQRHANPLSVYSRMSILPLLTLAVLSRAWLGWGALVPIALVAVWTWWNPRAFSAPKTTKSWAAHGTFGERVMLNHAEIPVPDHHMSWARALAALAGVGIIPWVYGLWQLDFGFILLGLAVTMGGKIWFVDRMVWLYQDMKSASPTYAGWER
ncbi:hypothetical protein KMP13_06175 [Epibacterium ulvae]|uniref:DUF6653 family protein n=1 Tax=Epibacterium ulvae TaxID=1156985 RepID=UPI001BFC795B|nr:DUF6653 family protein [Epibacterium ulvae]MBT8153487.1 hypothetical protein [Epibacterium ulvae]